MSDITLEAIETLKKSKVDGLVVKLPQGQLDRKIYLEVKKRLELIGGSWKGGKVSGFVFQEDPSDLLEEIVNGNKRNLKKEFQFFGTPDELADKLVSLASIKEDDCVLEPSAGQGAIINAIHRAHPSVSVDYCELMDLNQKVLNKSVDNSLTTFKGADFLNYETASNMLGYYKIVANPPFSKNQDIDHIKQMYALLFEGGTMVSIASKHWQMSSNKKETEFKEWLDKVNAEIIEIEAGAFKESGTMISSCIIVIKK